MTPALARLFVLVCVRTCALMPPSATNDCQTKWNWSAVPPMSFPSPAIVQTPLLSDWLPARGGLPMSAQLQPVGQGAVVFGATLVDGTGESVEVLVAGAGVPVE